METILLGLVALPFILSPLIYLMGRLQAPIYDFGGWTTQSRLQTGLAYRVGLFALLATGAVFLLVTHFFDLYGPLTIVIGAAPMQFDGLSRLLIMMTLTLGLLATLSSGPYLAGEAGGEKFYALLTAMIGAIIGLACAADLFNLWLWFETMAISSYFLVAFYPERPASLEAGVKYLVQSATGSALILLGVALVLAQTGSLNLDQIRLTASAGPGLLAAGALFSIGFGVKIALVPLHTWLPDAHAQAPSGISAMLSGVVIEAGLIALLRVLAALSAVTLSWGGLLMGFGLLNMVVGNLLALRQTQLKRLLAYSSLSHIGYMLFGLGIGLYAGQIAGLQGGFFHLLTHGLMKGLAFLAAGVLLYALYLAKGNHASLKIGDLAGAAHRYPLTAMSLSVALLGLGGLPPLAGFMSKWQILAAGFGTQNMVIYGLVIVAGLNSVLSLAYYAPVVNMMYRQQPSAAVQRGQRIPTVMRVPLILLALLVVVIGFWPNLLSWLTEPAAATLLTSFAR